MPRPCMLRAWFLHGSTDARVMMEFMMKFGFNGAALAVSGQGPGRVQRPGLGSQHQMACLTNNLYYCVARFDIS